MGKPKPLTCDAKLFEQDLTGKVILITGAGAGIGLNCATKLFGMGATIVCAGRGSAQGLLEEVESAEAEASDGAAPAAAAPPAAAASKKNRMSLVGADLAASVAKLAVNADRKPVIMELDLASLASVRAFAAKFTEKFDRLDVLMNNAGVMMPPRSLTGDGFELQMGTNHYGHFLLTMLLKDTLEKTPDSRVLCTSPVFFNVSLVHPRRVRAAKR